MDNVTTPEIRYWKRAAKDGMIYFATATNAGHSRAMNDPSASEITVEEYKQNVPPTVHNGADRAKAAPTEANPNLPKQAAWEALQAWTNTHGDTVTVQDQIAMLELWKFQLCAWATNTMAQQQNTPPPQAH